MTAKATEDGEGSSLEVIVIIAMLSIFNTEFTEPTEIFFLLCVLGELGGYTFFAIK